MEKLKDQYPLTVQWRSYELRPAGTPLPEAFRERIEEMRPRMQAMAREQYGLEINSGPFGIDARPALIGAKVAEAHGAGEAYHAATFRAYWEQAQDISETAVLQQIAIDIGLDGEQFVAALDDEQYSAQVTNDIEQAFAYGLSGVPALVFAQKYLIVGAQPLPVLTQVVEKVLAES